MATAPVVAMLPAPAFITANTAPAPIFFNPPPAYLAAYIEAIRREMDEGIMAAFKSGPGQHITFDEGV